MEAGVLVRFSCRFMENNKKTGPSLLFTAQDSRFESSNTIWCDDAHALTIQKDWETFAADGAGDGGKTNT